MQVRALDDDVVRLRRDGLLLVAKLHEGVEIRAAGRRDFQADEAIVMRARHGRDDAS
jgi:hypothetical protein